MCKLSLVLSCSALITLGTLGACSSSPSTNVDAAPPPPPPIDAAAPAIDAPAPPIDAPPPPTGVATEVTCADFPSAPTVTTPGFAYTPQRTMIPVGGVVKFTMSDEHDVASSTMGLKVAFSATKCLKFATAGTYTFHCTPHGFTGTIAVQ